jgi:hypothetical protein
MKRRTTVRLAVPAILAALAAWYFLAGHTTPAGQPPLATLTSESWSIFKTEFNESADYVRLVVLLSPT